MTGDQHALTSSTLIRQIVALGGDLGKLAPLVPAAVLARLRRMQKKGTWKRAVEVDTPVT
jgi:hypothetical protein